MKLTGWKTYLVAVGMGIATIAKALGYIDETTYITIMGILNGTGFATLRSGMKTEAKKEG
jgi:ABC-type sugar transport system substrate-binding protein